MSHFPVEQAGLERDRGIPAIRCILHQGLLRGTKGEFAAVAPRSASALAPSHNYVLDSENDFWAVS